jgi:uncharacterized protein YdiU (UPF0061 family)
MFKFESTYSKLPDRFYQKLGSTSFENPHILKWNDPLAESFRIVKKQFSESELAHVFSAKVLNDSAKPIAQAYSGHQFGHFNPHLGDGRAMLLGELLNEDGLLYDVHLKGSGPTKFSRRGDGFAQLGAIVREYLVSECLYSLGIPTTRTMAIIGTGQIVARENHQPGAIQVRTARSHVRIGTFEHFAARQDFEAVKLLADYSIDRLYSDLQKNREGYLQFFRHVILNQVKLVSKWMAYGFIHGVMNTDNTLISGETIDFGPCAFMESYDPLQVFSSIDHSGRYAYGRQPTILKWNLSCLGFSLLSLLHEERSVAEKLVENELNRFDELFDNEWMTLFQKKIGFNKASLNQAELVREFLEIIELKKMDFTLSFYFLKNFLFDDSDKYKIETDSQFKTVFNCVEFKLWLQKWKYILSNEGIDLNQAYSVMSAANPAILARNHLVQNAIDKIISENDWQEFEKIASGVHRAFRPEKDDTQLMFSATPENAVTETFCNT